MLFDNFEQKFDSCALSAQNAPKSAQNQINGLSTSRNELLKIFCGFRVLEYVLWEKYENPEMPKINRKLSKLENTHC